MRLLTSYCLEANKIISREFSYLFPHTFRQSACHLLQINTKEKKSSESEKHLGGKTPCRSYKTELRHQKQGK